MFKLALIIAIYSGPGHVSVSQQEYVFETEASCLAAKTYYDSTEFNKSIGGNVSSVHVNTQCLTDRRVRITWQTK
jgi:hypothetical protein